MCQWTSYIFQDWEINRSTSFKSRLVLVMFRLAQLLGRLPFPIFLYRFLYQLIVEGILGIELPWNTQIGSSLQLQHGIALVVNQKTKIGEHCVLRNSTTIGNKKLADGSYSDSPTIGNHVDIGCNVVILGSINIGNYAVIGAGSVVVKDVPEGAIVAGNPARLIRMINYHASDLLICDELTSCQAAKISKH